MFQHRRKDEGGGGGGGTVTTSPFNKIERMLKDMLRPFCQGLENIFVDHYSWIKEY